MIYHCLLYGITSGWQKSILMYTPWHCFFLADIVSSWQEIIAFSWQKIILLSPPWQCFFLRADSWHCFFSTEEYTSMPPPWLWFECLFRGIASSWQKGILVSSSWHCSSWQNCILLFTSWHCFLLTANYINVSSVTASWEQIRGIAFSWQKSI